MTLPEYLHGPSVVGDDQANDPFQRCGVDMFLLEPFDVTLEFGGELRVAACRNSDVEHLEHLIGVGEAGSAPLSNVLRFVECLDRLAVWLPIPEVQGNPVLTHDLTVESSRYRRQVKAEIFRDLRGTFLR